MALENVLRLNSGEQEIFAETVRTLLSEIFLIRTVDGDKELYQFALKNFTALEEWFSFVGLSLYKDESLGVVAFRGEGSERSNLNLEETLGLLVLLILYNEKQNELSLQSEITAQQLEFQDRFKVLTERSISKTRFIQMLRRLQSLKLIRVMGEMEDPGSLIVLYPSIAFVLDGRDIDEAFQVLSERISEEEEI